MRIALDARKMTRTDSGIGTYTLNLARALLEEDKDIELLLVYDATRKQRRLQSPRVEEVVFPFPPTSPFTQFALGPWLRRPRGQREQHPNCARPSQPPGIEKDFRAQDN